MTAADPGPSGIIQRVRGESQAAGVFGAAPAARSSERAWMLALGVLAAVAVGVAAGGGQLAFAVLLVAAPAFAVVAIAAPERTAVALIVALPFFFYPTTVGQFSLFLAVPTFGFVALILTLRERAVLQRLHGALPVAAYAALVVIAIAMAALSDDPTTAFTRVVYLVLFGWFAGALALTLQDGRLSVDTVVKAIVAAGALAAIAVLAQFIAQFVGGRQSVIDWMQNLYPQFGGAKAAAKNLQTSNWVLENPEVLRGVFPFMAPASAGQFLMLTLIAAVWSYRERLHQGRLPGAPAAQLAVIVLIGAGLLATFSRQAWLGAVVGLLALGLRRRPALTVGVVALAIVALAALPIPGGSGTFGQYLLTASDASSTSSAGRITLWGDAINLIPSHAVVGVGPGLFGTLNPSGKGVFYAHNMFLDAAIELGVAGAVALLAVFGGGLMSALRRPGTPAFAMLTAYATANLFDDSLLLPRNGLLLATTFALLAAPIRVGARALRSQSAVVVGRRATAPA